MHGMASSEIKDLWLTCDLNGDNHISFEEWSKFYKIFIVPFEKCIGENPKGYIIEKSTLEKCFHTDSLQGFYWNYKNDEKTSRLILNILDRTNQQNINLANYIFLRRINVARVGTAR